MSCSDDLSLTSRLTFAQSSSYKEAFARFDKKGTGAVPREVLGDLLRALGQNPTQAEVAEIVSSAPRDGQLSDRYCVEDGRIDLAHRQWTTKPS